MKATMSNTFISLIVVFLSTVFTGIFHRDTRQPNDTSMHMLHQGLDINVLPSNCEEEIDSLVIELDEKLKVIKQQQSIISGQSILAKNNQ